MSFWGVGLSTYIQKACMGDAHNVFDEMSHRNVALWNDMIAGCTENGITDEVLVLFYRMK